MLSAIEKLNADFYPVPIRVPQELANGMKKVELAEDGCLTREEFVVLYDRSSEFLHSRNPFTEKAPVVNLEYSTEEWVSRIQKLIALHFVCLTDGRRWIVQAESNQPVHVWTAEPSVG